jgi:hypothetical protein
MSLFWEMYQHRRIMDAQNAAERAGGRVDRQAESVAELQRSVDRLSLACQAMWELLRDRAGITDQDLEAKILEVDGRDGKLDGRITAAAINCPSCGRKTSPKRDRCVMCGAATSRPNVF